MPRKTKFEALVVNAIRRIQASHASTTSQIVDYLSKRYTTGPDLRRQIQQAIRRGVNYGILRRMKKGYVTCDHNIPVIKNSEVTECHSCRKNMRQNVSRGLQPKSLREKLKRKGRIEDHAKVHKLHKSLDKGIPNKTQGRRPRSSRNVTEDKNEYMPQSSMETRDRSVSKSPPPEEPSDEPQTTTDELSTQETVLNYIS